MCFTIYELGACGQMTYGRSERLETPCNIDSNKITDVVHCFLQREHFVQCNHRAGSEMFTLRVT